MFTRKVADMSTRTKRAPVNRWAGSDQITLIMMIMMVRVARLQRRNIKRNLDTFLLISGVSGNDF